MKRIIFILFLFMFGVSFADSSREHPCEKKDLLGSWNLMAMHILQSPGRGSPLLYKHQERIFYKNGEMRHFVSATPLTKEMKKKFEKSPRTVRYSIDFSGIVTINVSGRTTDRFACRVTKTRDLLFTWTKLGEPALVQRFRKAD